jgi:nucleotide-binding universal stress UspA family protein
MRTSEHPDDYLQRVAEGPEAVHASIRSMLEPLGVRAEFHSASGDPAEAIVRTADQVGADLIVVGNRGMKGVRRVLGSVPNTVAHSADCSVMIVDTAEAG